MSLTIAVLADAFEHLSLEEVLAWCADHDVTELELGAAGYSPSPHLSRESVLSDPPARRELISRLDDAGSRIVALNASGNPLHPAAAVAADHDRGLRETLRLAAQLGVGSVVAMSGCPGGPGPGGWPVFAGGAWLPDMEGLWEQQWRDVIAPYWRELSAWALREAPGVSICLELHPGTSIYNAASFAMLREVTGENVGVNFDPSHFWWQGIDPIVTLGAIGEHVRFAHGKDTLLHADRIALHGVLDFRWPAGVDTMPWHFCAVGAGRPLEEWATLVGALEAAGYDGPISVEHEDPNLTPEAGVAASILGLRTALASPPARRSAASDG